MPKHHITRVLLGAAILASSACGRREQPEETAVADVQSEKPSSYMTDHGVKVLLRYPTSEEVLADDYRMGDVPVQCDSTPGGLWRDTNVPPEYSWPVIDSWVSRYGRGGGLVAGRLDDQQVIIFLDMSRARSIRLNGPEPGPFRFLILRRAQWYHFRQEIRTRSPDLHIMSGDSARHFLSGACIKGID
jgi:hypothetical protein